MIGRDAALRGTTSRYAALAAGLAVLWLAVLPVRPLFNPDEGRYAEIPREMLTSGDWVVPHLNGLVYIEKPPLQYWATALALRTLGSGALGARLYTALCALGTLALVWLAAARLGGRDAGWRAAAVLSSMVLFVVLGQLLTLDMSLTLYMTASLVAFLLAQQGAAAPDGRRRARRWMLAAWSAAALGVLTKGLVAAAIPAAVLVLHGLLTRDWSPWRRLSAGAGLLLFLALTVPWHWLAARRVPGFLEFFFVHEHLSRYLTPSADREEAWWFFAAVFLLGSLPWTLPALRVVLTGWRTRTPATGFATGRFLWLWTVFICVFFSLSDSKLIPYVLPALPSLALSIALQPAAAAVRDLRATVVLTLVAAVLCGVACLIGPRFIAGTARGPYFAQLALPLGGVAALLALCATLVLAWRRHGTTLGAVILGAGWCCAALLLMCAAAVVAPIYSGIELARAVPLIPPGTPLYSVASYDQTLPFYWRHTFHLVSYRGELAFGLHLDPDAEIPSVPAFVAAWRAQSDGYAVMERPMFDELLAQGVPMREVAHDVRRVLVSRE